MEGWTVRIEDAVFTDAKTWTAGKQELQRQLQSIARVVPDEPLAQLRKVAIYVTVAPSGCAAYHPSEVWLTEHKMDPAMATNIEISNLPNFVSWTYEQPWMVMHEMAHAYMFRVLDKGPLGKDIRDTFDAAVKSKRYEKVLRYTGGQERHYALNNEKEFFAEMTEAYFGTNDTYPFVRAELQTYDPETFALMERVWGKPVKRTTVNSGG
jgi:hypothetical protein